MRHLARVAFFLSGIAGLTFEIVWTRYLGLAIGTTTVAVATVTATYMGGLALGSHIGGRVADRLRRPFLVYGALEIGIGLVGIGIPVLCLQVSALDAAMATESAIARALLRFCTAAAILALPTTAMGMTLPILTRVVTDKKECVGREVGLLYAVNIGGAVLGAALAGFWWIPTIGRNSTNSVAVGLDILLGVVAVAGGILLGPRSSAADGGEAPPQSPVASPLLSPGGRWLVGMLGITGAAAMALQVLWTRAVATALGPSTYAFSAIVCAYLAGLAFGSAFASRLADQTIHRRFALALVLSGTGVTALAGIALVDDLPLLLHSVVMDSTLTMGRLLRTKFVLAALSVLPAASFMGAILPLTLSAVVGSDARIGAAVGRAYAVNTVGAVAGAFAGAFVLLPVFGVEWGMRVTAALYLVLAMVLASNLELSVCDRHRRLLLAAMAVLLFVTFAWPSWNVGQWTLGIYRLSLAREFYTHGAPRPSQVIFHRDGLAATVTVEEGGGSRWIKIDGKIDGSSAGDMPTQVLSGLLVEVFHPQAKRVVVVGCGSGVTVGSLLLSDVEEVTLIELEAAVLEAAPLFAAVNHNPLGDPRLRVVTNDGRNFLRRGLGQESFDVIISEPSNPWMTGSASLFTAEYFAIAQKRLVPGGLFVQWLQIYELSPQRIASVLKTFHHVFPHVLVISAHRDSNDLLLFGSSEPLTFHWQDVTRLFLHHGQELSRAGLHNPEQLLALFLFSEQEIAALDAPLNTDDNGLIEFGAPRDLLTYAEEDPDVTVVAALKGRRYQLIQRLAVVAPDAWPDRLGDLAVGFLHQGMLPDVAGVTSFLVERYPEHQVAARAVEIAELALLLADEDQVVVLDRDAVAVDPQYAVLARLLVEGDLTAALRQMRAVPELTRRTMAHQLLFGYLLYAEGELKEAARVLSLASERVDKDGARAAALAYYQGKVAFEDGDYIEAASKMRQFWRLSKRLSDGAERD